MARLIRAAAIGQGSNAPTYTEVFELAKRNLDRSGGSAAERLLIERTLRSTLNRTSSSLTSPCDPSVFMKDCFYPVLEQQGKGKRAKLRVDYSGARALLDAFAQLAARSATGMVDMPSAIECVNDSSATDSDADGGVVLKTPFSPPSSLPSVETAPKAKPVEVLGKHAGRSTRTKRFARKRFNVRALSDTKSGETRWEVSGVLNGKQLRLRFRRKSDADEKAHRLNLQATGGVDLRETVTVLPDNILRDAEAAHRLLSSKYPSTTITDTVSFYLANFKPCGSDHTVLTALEPFLDSRRAKGRSIRQIENYKYRLKRFASYVPDLRLHEISRTEVTGFLNSDPKWAPASWNGYYADILAFLNWCMHEDRKWIATNPAQGLERKPKTHREVEILALKSCRMLMSHVDQRNEPAVAMIFALGLFTGIRPDFKNGEFFELGEKVRAGKASQHFRLDEKELFLSCDMTKDKRKRYTDLHPNLLAWLKKYPPTPESFSGAVIDRHYGAIRKQFKIPHDGLRHTYISAYARLHGMADAATQAGNSVDIIKEHYYRQMSKETAEAFWQIMPTF